ncbi:extracellular solute-binding protein [Bifidobacterium sp. BRDM6]|uniref:Extracellular solute-binding protein n=2 Tax=Bifidobacterium choloepi TaxID=2614131 RepID=A0A6I5NHY0_9BIFI|nr:extracellular solute-binding protein [Bifidobacterium choloepi]
MGFGLAGCGSASQTITLDFFQFKAEAASWFTAKAEEFEKTHPNIKIKVNNSSDATTDLRTRLVKDRVPDVMTVNGDINYGLLAETGVFHDFTDDEFVDELNPGMVEIARSLVQTKDESKKRLYALPYAGNASGYIINSELWRQEGLDPTDPPKTWSEFIKVLQKFKDDGIAPLEFSYADSWTIAAPLSSLNSTLVPVSEYTDLARGDTTLQTLWKPCADELATLFGDYAQANPAITYQQATQDFANGKAAILPLGTYAIPQVQLINADMDFEFAQMPASDNADEQQLTAGDDVLITIGANTKHYKEAREFVDFLYQEDNIEDYCKNQSAFGPYRDTYVGNDALTNVLPFFEQSRITDFCDHFVPASINLNGYLQALATTRDVNYFLNSLQAAYEKIEARNFR